MRVMLLYCVLVLLFASGCAAPQSAAPTAPLSLHEREALAQASRQRVELAMRTSWGLPDWAQELLARRAAEEAAKLAPRPAAPALPPITRPSQIPGVRRLLIVGDSFAVGIGMTMSGQLKGMGVRLAERGKVSSGLNSPHFYNWEQKLREFLASERPDALVAMMSGNDAHNGSGSQSWKQDYVERMRRFVSIAADAGVAVYLVGLPPMGKPDYSSRARVANEAAAQVCAENPACHYVDAWRIFSDDAGNYVQVKSFNGSPVTLRAKDGVHFTMNGYRILSSAILERIASTYAQASSQ